MKKTSDKNYNRNKQCPKCVKGWYMLISITEKGNLVYTCPTCNHKIYRKSPEKKK